jgi:hypothetical protein
MTTSVIARNAGDQRWALRWGLVLVVVAVGFPLAFWGMFNGTKEIFVYAGTVLTALVALIAHTLTRQSNQRLDAERIDHNKQLKLDAAMRAGELFSAKENTAVDAAAAASGLMALTRLGQAELAVALLVDLWSEGKDRVSDETAILVIDAALRQNEQPNARLVAAELLCRNAERLSPCQSLHWPSVLDGQWDPDFGPRTKLLLVEALLRMTMAAETSENALRSVAVRLYGIWARDPFLRHEGCVATLLKAIVPSLRQFGYTDFMQGDQKVLLPQLEEAAATAHRKQDLFLAKLVDCEAARLTEWASRCDMVRDFRGCLAAAVQQPA